MLYEDYKNDLMELDPVELLEKFNITSWDLIERFEERIEADFYSQEIQDDYYDYSEEDE